MPNSEQPPADPLPAPAERAVELAKPSRERVVQLDELVHGARVDEQPVHPGSLAWAGVVRWFSVGVLLLVAFVVASPLLAIFFGFEGLSAKDRVDAFFKWGNTTLPTVVGLGSAVIAYYYGRNTK